MVEKFKVTDISVYWFGINGWNAEEKWKASVPPFNNIEIEFPQKSNELGGIRPDIKDEQEKRRQQILKIAVQAEARDYQNRIGQSLSSLTQDILIPSQTVSSPATDINGTFGRFSQPLPISKHIVLIITDGRQNKNLNYTINKTPFPNNTKFVVVLVPGTKDAGQDDYEARRENFKTAYPSCLVIPHYTTDITALINEAEANNINATR